MNALNSTRLRELVDYNPTTGVFTRKVAIAQHTKIGAVAGTLHKQGYIHIGVAGARYKAHRLVWLYVHGEWPDGDIDHINGNRADNRLANLRQVSRQLNAENRRTARAGHATGYLGVVWRPRNKKYEARIYVDKTYKYLGLFSTAEEAHEAYIKAKRQHHAGCTI